MAKKTKLAKFKDDKYWKWKSKYIRLKYSDMDGMCKCVTCQTVKYWKEMQAGHYSDSRCNSLLLEGIIRPQCYSCNCMKSGNKNQYTFYLVDVEGLTLDDLKADEYLKNKIVKMRWQDWEEEYLKIKELAQLEFVKRGLCI